MVATGENPANPTFCSKELRVGISRQKIKRAEEKAVHVHNGTLVKTTILCASLSVRQASTDSYGLGFKKSILEQAV